MLINVPQYIDVEDKVAGPLTMKQLGWLIALGIILLVMWKTVPGPVFFIVGLPIAILFVALAFYKPYGQPFGSFVWFGIMYFFRPKVYVWKRTPQIIVQPTTTNVQRATVRTEKHISSQSLGELATLLDTKGAQYNDDLEEILKKPIIKKS